MPQGDVQPAAKRRPQPAPARIAARVARLARKAKRVPGVQALNPGFFALEGIRAGGVAKKRGVTKRRVK